jgi:hypothetical protein
MVKRLLVEHLRQEVNKLLAQALVIQNSKEWVWLQGLLQQLRPLGLERYLSGKPEAVYERDAGLQGIIRITINWK